MSRYSLQGGNVLRHAALASLQLPKDGHSEDGRIKEAAGVTETEERCPTSGK